MSQIVQPCIYVVLDSEKRLVCVFTDLDRAVDLCSRRHHFVRHAVWRNVRNETTFHNYSIEKVVLDTFPSKHESIQFDILPEETYAAEICKLNALKEQVMERAKTAETSLKSIERVMEEERGENWTKTLNDSEYDVLVLFEDAMYEESMYEPWSVTAPPPRNIRNYLDGGDVNPLRILYDRGQRLVSITNTGKNDIIHA